MVRFEELESLFKPFKLGNVTLNNRIVMAPMGTGLSDHDGNVTEQLIAYYAERARGKPGLITVEAASVDYPAGYLGPFEMRMDNDSYISGLARLADAIKSEDVKASIQLSHAGRYANSKNTGVQAVAPSPVQSRYTGETPRELSTFEVEEIIEEFGEGARRAREAGFDAVELMASTGYLFSQFLSPITNKRTDRFGGDIRNRAAFAVEVVLSIRRRVGSEFPISFKFSVEDLLPGGNTIDDSLIVAQGVLSAGASVLHIWTGWHESPVALLPMSVPRGVIVHLAEKVKKAVNAPVITVGRINDPGLAAQIVRDEKADLVAMGRAFLADPYIMLKAAEGKLEEIRPCIACCRCFDNVIASMKSARVHQPVVCSINAEVAREWQKKVRPADHARSILVVGGGPAGMEVARVAAQRGHKVTLWEKNGQLGGNVLLATVPPYKEELNGFIDYLRHQMRILDIDVHLGKEARAQEVIDGHYDEVVLATGGQPVVPDLPGVRDGKAVTALDVLRGAEVGAAVVIIGGGMVGCETAEYLAQRGKKVTIVEMLARLALDVGPASRWVLLQRIKDAGITELKETKFIGMDDGQVVVEGNGRQQQLEADTIVFAMGMYAERRLYNELQGRIEHLHLVGDCVDCKTIHEAIHTAWELGCTV